MLLLIELALADCTVLSGGLVYLDGRPVQQDVVIVDGRIASRPTADCVTTSVEGKHVTAGLIDPSTGLGLIEVSMEHRQHDISSSGAGYRVVDGYNPRSTLIPVARMGGVTSAVTAPSGGLVSGTALFVDLAGDTQATAIVDEDVAMFVSIGENGSESLYRLRLLLDEARRYKGSWDATRFTQPEADLKALQPVLRRELPLVVSVERASDIEALLRFVDEQRVRVILKGASEAWMLADELAERDIPVILDSFVRGPGSFDQVHGRADSAAILHEAGVMVMFSTFSAHNPRELTQYAGNAVREGMPHDQALLAITANPAKALGIDHYGTLRTGSVANVVVWSADPLELTSSVEQVWIHGEQQALESRQTRLRDRYWILPGSPVPALELD